ncbi:MAG: MFS transporter [Bacilli bacterium]|nr:MFS transporter [Bacilli bacterium]
MAEKRKSFFETPLMRTKIKSATVSLFPEAALGYLLGPILALLANGVVNIWLVQYWDKVLGLGTWAPLFETLLPIISAIVIVIGNLFVGRLMERKPSLAGKARPLILIGMPVVAVALLVLFLVPLPAAAGEQTIIESMLPGHSLPTDGMLLASILIAVGYNLYYAIAWPLYYTSHSALVNLSTRDGGARGLLGTAIMAAQLAAAGVSGMFGGILVDLLGLLPVYKFSDVYVAAHAAELGEGVTKTNDFNLVKSLIPGVDYTTEITRAEANSRWTILLIVMVAALIIGCLLEYFFTRERITEEAVKNAEAVAASGEEVKEVKKVSMADQIKVCIKDKYWWFIIIFFFLYQFGGQMKNNAMSFYSQSMTGGNSVSSVINTVGAIPTALGMAIVWPIAAKLTKSKTIALGGVIAFLAAAVCYIPVFANTGIAATTGIAVASFCVKALGTAPAMYISIALMANVLDHQEAVHGIRTDGFTMAVYGSIMVAMSGVCNGIIVGLNNAMPAVGRMLNTTLAFGVEGVCYLAIAAMFIFMNVEKFSKVDNLAIVADQKAKVLAAGGEWVEPAVRAEQEAAENARLVEEARVDQLKKDCEKKGLDFDAENEKFLAKKAENDAKAAAKKADADAKKAAKEAAIPAEVKEARAAKEAEALENARVDLNKARVAAGLPEYVA